MSNNDIETIGNANVTKSIELDEIIYLLEDYTEHLEKTFEVNLRTYDGSGFHGHTVMQTAKEYWEEKMKGK